MSRFFAELPEAAKQDAYAQITQQTGVPQVIVEKDFWVCWLLGQVFSTPGLGSRCVFKGGTSLSKVFNVIQRFSEDIDLGISPASLGWNEADLDDAPNPTQRRKRMDELMAKCAASVRNHFQPELESTVCAALGPRPEGPGWLTYTDDIVAHSPVLWFRYPSLAPAGTDYIERAVKIEFGSLTDQRPTGTHPISPLVAQLAPEIFADFTAEVVALEIERTFWEKATILHAEYHRPAHKPQPTRYARHYSDFAALWLNPAGRPASRQLDLLARVRLHKSRFFASAWANYATAVPGTFHLLPPDTRLAELRADYEAMRPMFLNEPLSFTALLAVLREAERTLNQT